MTQLTLGEALRDEGMARVDAATDEEWKMAADLAIAELAASGRVFTADHVRALAGDPPRPNALGARIHAHARAGTIERVGYGKAGRASRHSSVMAKWRGAL